MTTKNSKLAKMFLAEARHRLATHYLPRISECLKILPEKEIWWRPNPASNSAGNLVLHLMGNVRQWIISGLGSAPDRRERDREFAERGPIPRRSLLLKLHSTVTEACDVLARLSPKALAQTYRIQGFEVTGLVAVFHVVEHFAYHSGQIIFVTKLRRGKDLGFTRLPGEQARAGIHSPMSLSGKV